jgi:beta-1,4-mannosyl-glycoprotein beta-1,4-N-acetylglucosaminyltransferase
MAIYDVFMFFNEFDLLEVRLEEHDPFVDCFVLIQADRTHAGQPKEYLFSIDNPRFSQYAHKIKVVNVPLLENPETAWVNENLQRQASFTGVDYRPEDIVFMSDVDEIISRDKWPYLLQRIKTESLLAVTLRTFYYFINLEMVEYPWTPAKLLRAKVFLENDLSAAEIRLSSAVLIPPEPCGWHFSFLMTPEQIVKKLNAYAHQEYNHEKFTEPNAIYRAIKEKRDLFGRELNFRALRVNQSWPKAMLRIPLWKKFVCPVSVREFWVQEILLKIRKICRNWARGWLGPVRSWLGNRALVPDDADTIGSQLFQQLMTCRPISQNEQEWRRLIEFFGFVLLKIKGLESARECAELFLSVVKSGGYPVHQIVEVGSRDGRASVFLSRAATIMGSKVVCVEWDKSSAEESIRLRKNLALYGCDNVVVCKERADSTLEPWCFGPIDLWVVHAQKGSLEFSRLHKSWSRHFHPKTRIVTLGEKSCGVPVLGAETASPLVSV